MPMSICRKVGREWHSPVPTPFERLYLECCEYGNLKGTDSLMRSRYVSRLHCSRHDTHYCVLYFSVHGKKASLNCEDYIFRHSGVGKTAASGAFLCFIMLI